MKYYLETTFQSPGTAKFAGLYEVLRTQPDPDALPLPALIYQHIYRGMIVASGVVDKPDTQNHYLEFTDSLTAGIIAAGTAAGWRYVRADAKVLKEDAPYTLIHIDFGRDGLSVEESDFNTSKDPYPLQFSRLPSLFGHMVRLGVADHKRDIKTLKSLTVWFGREWSRAAIREASALAEAAGLADSSQG